MNNLKSIPAPSSINKLAMSILYECKVKRENLEKLGWDFDRFNIPKDAIVGLKLEGDQEELTAYFKIGTLDWDFTWNTTKTIEHILKLKTEKLIISSSDQSYDENGNWISTFKIS